MAVFCVVVVVMQSNMRRGSGGGVGVNDGNA